MLGFEVSVVYVYIYIYFSRVKVMVGFMCLKGFRVRVFSFVTYSFEPDVYSTRVRLSYFLYTVMEITIQVFS